MAPIGDSDPLVAQGFEAEDGSPLASLPTLECTETGERYLLWTDILGSFPGISLLQDSIGSRVLFMIDPRGEM